MSKRLPPPYEPTIPARYTAPLLEALREQRTPWLAGVLADVGLDRAMLRDDSAMLTMARFDALLSALAAHTGREDLGFDLGRHISLAHHGALAAMLPRCATLDEMLRMFSRYSRLITPTFFLRYRRDADHGEFSWRPAAAMSRGTLRAVEEVVAVSFHVQVRTALAQRIGRYDIHLSMPPPRHAARYRELRPARFHFADLPLPEVRFVMSAALLDAPLRRAEDDATPSAAADLAGLQRRIGRPVRWSEWVAMMLREAEGTQPSLPELAELLSVSPRTLTRYLADEGHTLRELGNEVRHRRACDMLRDRRQSIAEIAWRLGYSDPTNFSHAFRAAAGRSPRAHRAGL